MQVTKRIYLVCWWRHWKRPEVYRWKDVTGFGFNQISIFFGPFEIRLWSATPRKVS